MSVAMGEVSIVRKCSLKRVRDSPRKKHERFIRVREGVRVAACNHASKERNEELEFSYAGSVKNTFFPSGHIRRYILEAIFLNLSCLNYPSILFQLQFFLQLYII